MEPKQPKQQLSHGWWRRWQYHPLGLGKSDGISAHDYRKAGAAVFAVSRKSRQ